MYRLKSLLTVHQYLLTRGDLPRTLKIPYLEMGFALEMLSALIPYGYSFPAMQG